MGRRMRSGLVGLMSLGALPGVLWDPSVGAAQTQVVVGPNGMTWPPFSSVDYVFYQHETRSKWGSASGAGPSQFQWAGDGQPAHLYSRARALAIEAGGAVQFVRWSAGMSFDSSRGETLLFGGGLGAGNLGNDTWAWDGSVWTQRATGSPSGRYGTAMVYDVFRNVSVLFGGLTASSGTNQTWEWNGTTWTQR